nr:MAG TPA: hypothetical protein [Caudoviricetes sp.]
MNSVHTYHHPRTVLHKTGKKSREKLKLGKINKKNIYILGIF